MKKILLLGAGYANMSLLTRLDEKTLSKAEWILISKEPYHYKSICLHDVASGKHDKSVLFNLDSVLNKKITIIQDEITQIQSNLVKGLKSSYEYDYLIVGLGFASDDFGIKGVKEYAKSITSYKSAREIYASIHSKLEEYKQHNDEANLSFAVCGGGFSGIEFAGSLAQELQKKCFDFGIDFRNVKIYCIEAAPNILPMFSDSLKQASIKKLESLGVQVLSNSKILECKQDAVIISKNAQESEIKANTIIWTAGVRGNPVIENSPIFVSARSRVEVDEFLRPKSLNAPNINNIFVIGDCSSVRDEKSDRFFPPTAQISREQGKYLAQSLQILLKKKVQKALDSSQALDSLAFRASPHNPFGSKIVPFRFTPKGSICSIGEGYAVGALGSFEIKGLPASILKNIVESLWNWQLKGFSL